MNKKAIMKNVKMKKNINSERGQSLVELAISLLILLWLLAGAVEFGIALFQYIQLRDAAQEGALYGSVNPSDTVGIEMRARNASSSPLDLSILPPDPNAVRITITTSGGGCIADGITVRLEYDHQIFMPFASLFMDSPLTIGAQVTDTILSSTC